MAFRNFILTVSSVCSDKLINNRFVSLVWLHDSSYKFPSVRENILAVCKCHSVRWRHCFTTWLKPVPADRLGYSRFSYASTPDVLKCVRCNAVNFDVLLTARLSIFISVYAVDAQNFCFTISLFHASTCFEHMCSLAGGQNCITEPLLSSHWNKWEV